MRALQYAIEKRELHHLLAAEPRLPQIGIQQTEADEREEGTCEQYLLTQDQTACRSPRGRQLPAPPAPEKKREQSQAAQSHVRHGRTIGQDASARAEPHEVAHQQETKCLTQGVASIRERAKDESRDGPGGESQQLHHDPPHEDGCGRM